MRPGALELVGGAVIELERRALGLLLVDIAKRLGQGAVGRLELPDVKLDDRLDLLARQLREAT